MSGTKRGGSSAKGKNPQAQIKENTATSKHLHQNGYGGEDEYASEEQRIAWIMEDTGMSKSDAKKTAELIMDWSNTGIYEDIRDAQAQGKSSKEGDLVESYITRMPKFSGKIYRGIALDEQEDVDNIISALRSGKRISMNGTSSWTSRKDAAESFAQEHGTGILFVSGNPKAAATIQHLSYWGKNEGEILASKRVQYSSKKITYDKQNDFYTVYVDEYV